MKRFTKRMGAALLAAGLGATQCVPAMAADSYIQGTFTFGAHDNEKDLTDSYIYTDAYFNNSAYNTDHHLAIMSMIMASASISSSDVDYPEKSRNIQDLLTQIGFQNVEVNQYYKEQMQQNTMGACVAYKDLGDSVLLAVVPRSAGYEREWGGNFNVGASGLHEGFRTGRDIVLGFAKDYVNNHKDAFQGKTVKVWTMGYSRGAAVANLIGGALTDDPAGYIGVDVKPENIYDYTFGTPETTPSEMNPRAEKYNHIHNYFADYDPVTMAPLAAWGFDRYGKDEALDVHNAETKAKMLEYLAKTNPIVYSNYTSTESIEDPDHFTAMTLGAGLSIVPDTTRTVTQKDFLEERLDYLVRKAVPDRATYATDYQPAFTAAVSMMLGEEDEVADAFKQGAAASTYAKPALVMMFFYDWVEEYADQNGEETQLPENWEEEILPDPVSTEEGNSTGNETADTFLGSEEYKEAYDQAMSINLSDQYDMETYGDVTKVYKEMLISYTSQMLADGLRATGISEEEVKAHPMLQGNVPAALSEAMAKALFGTDDEISIAGIVSKVNTAATFIGNSSYMRVHNNEVILSWLRAMDKDPIQVPEQDPAKDPEKKEDGTGETDKKEEVAGDTPTETTPTTAQTKPTATDKTAKEIKTKAAKTGDTAAVGVWAAVAAIAVAGIGITLYLRRRKGK